MVNVCVCGAAGGIGQPLSLLLKQSLPAGSTLRLLDVVNAPGVAVDLSHVDTPVKVTGHVAPMKPEDPDDSAAAFTGADIVVIPAGVPRKPGMTRADLFKINAGIVAGLIKNVTKYCPNAIICMITNPVNSMVPVAAEILKSAGCYDMKKLFGVTTLDIVRAKTFVAEKKGVSPKDLSNVLVVGGHSGETMLALLSQVKGAEVTEDEAAELRGKIANAGTVVVEAKAGAGSATLSMAHAAAQFVGSVVRAFKGEEDVKECAFVEVEARHGLPCKYFALQVHLGKEGAHKLDKPAPGTPAETKLYEELVTKLNEDIHIGEEYGKAYKL